MVQQCEIECPFCKKSVVRILKSESFMQAQRTHISAGTKYIYHRVPEKYKVLESCPNCGKSKKEIQKALDTGITKELSHAERLKRLRGAGLPTKIVSKKN